MTKEYNPQRFGAKCSSCPLAVDGKPCEPVPPQYRPQSRLAIIGTNPGTNEVIDRRPFTGRMGHVMQSSAKMLGINWREIHLGNAIACMPRTKMKASILKKAYECCRPRLATEINSLGASSILAVGNESFQVLSGKKSTINWGLVPTEGIEEFSSKTIIGAPWPTQKNVILFDKALERSRMHAEGTLPEWDWGTIHIGPNQRALDLLEAIHKSGEPIAFDTETKGMDPIRSEIMCLSLATKDIAVSVPWHGYDSVRFGWCPPLASYPFGAQIEAKVREILRDPKVLKVMHNCSHDILGAKYQNIIMAPPYADTLLAHHTLYAEMGHGLSTACAQFFSGPRWKTLFGADTDLKSAEKFIQRAPEVLRDYNAKDSLMTARLWAILYEELLAMPKGMEVYTEYMETNMVGMRMREAGVLIDQEALMAHREPREREANEALEKLNKMVLPFFPGHKDFNYDSPIQLKDLFFKKLKVRPTSFSKETGEPSTDETFLLSQIEGSHPLSAMIATELLNYRKAKKIIRTYIDGLEIMEDGKVHPIYKVYGTITGRWSSSEPNAQNVPKDMRNTWVANPGQWVVAADYSALELRIIALLASDEEFLEDFRLDRDSHIRTAAFAFQIPESRVRKDKERQMAKTIAYGSNYSTSEDATTIWSTLVKQFPKLTLKQVEMMVRKYHELHPWIRLWQNKTLRKAYALQYVEEPVSGRREYFRDGIVDPNKALNFPVQSFAGGLMNRAMLALDKEIQWGRESILAQIHDAAYLSVTDPYRGARLLQEHMAQSVTLNGHTIEFPIDVEIGPNMRDLKSWKKYLAVADEMSVDEWYQRSEEDGSL